MSAMVRICSFEWNNFQNKQSLGLQFLIEKLHPFLLGRPVGLNSDNVRSVQLFWDMQTPNVFALQWCFLLSVQ